MSYQCEHQPTESEGLLGINEVVELTGISAFTIRYYDKCGFFPNLIRGKRGVRSFKPSDVKQLKLVDALRRSGLSIEGIRYFVRLSKRGEETEADRRAIIQTQTTALEYQIAEAEESLELFRHIKVGVFAVRIPVRGVNPSAAAELKTHISSGDS